MKENERFFLKKLCIFWFRCRICYIIITYLFVRKNKDDSTAKEFYFLGRMFITDEYKEIKMESGHKAVEILYKLEEPVREELYDYLTDNQNI